MEKVLLRRAVMEDAKLLFEWRNDPATRSGSLQSEPLDWERHLKWLAACLDNPYRALYIAERCGAPAGTVRADRTDGEFELSWTVAPDCRGQGLGHVLVAALICKLPPNARFRAIVLAENVASHRIALSLGMEAVSEVGGFTTYRGRRGDL